ncbi:15097_t:CDS:2 [Gigaspora margarita]|uniref:15097_t:CDS:1 n=1 Tax=Gigaspora margarita TaxID=4874 RepID=A0ABM8W1Z2_GIGMA|nr:15097_t:CDS:2 [Gigaspora margarita]
MVLNQLNNIFLINLENQGKQSEEKKNGIIIFEKPNISPSVFEILIKFYYNMKNDIFTDLYQIALELVCRNPKVIFELEDFLKVDEDVLIRLLKSDCLRLEEFEIWEHLIKWGIENTESILDDDLTKWT